MANPIYPCLGTLVGDAVGAVCEEQAVFCMQINSRLQRK
jgi:hypothetical protein